VLFFGLFKKVALGLTLEELEMGCFHISHLFESDFLSPKLTGFSAINLMLDVNLAMPECLQTHGFL
jgi:hypothetical protein